MLAVYQSNVYIFMTYYAPPPNSLLIPPSYVLQSTAYMSALLYIYGPPNQDTQTMRVASLSVKTKRTRALQASKPHGRHNASRVDVWEFKGLFNATSDPSKVSTIPADGAVLKLTNSAGDVLNEVTFTGSECDFTHNSRRILCKQASGPSRLLMVKAAQKGSKSLGSAVWRMSGRFSKQDIVGNIAATPLGVTLVSGMTYVDIVPNCKVIAKNLAVRCKDTAVKHE